jgi:hypothetical protein
MRWLCSALLLVLGVTTAAAEIRVDESRYDNGKLIISGDTQPNRTVTLDKKYTTKSDGSGHFQFKVAYKPETCMSDLRAGNDIYSAVIAGCLDPGVRADKPPKLLLQPQH